MGQGVGEKVGGRGGGEVMCLGLYCISPNLSDVNLKDIFYGEKLYYDNILHTERSEC